MDFDFQDDPSPIAVREKAQAVETPGVSIAARPGVDETTEKAVESKNAGSHPLAGEKAQLLVGPVIQWDSVHLGGAACLGFLALYGGNVDVVVIALLWGSMSFVPFLLEWDRR